MIEFATALVSALFALGWALWSGRSLLRRTALARGEAARAGTLRAVVGAMLTPSSRALAALTLLLSFTAFIALGFVRRSAPADPTGSPIAFGAWLACSFMLGVLVASAAAHLATWASLRFVSAASARSAWLDPIERTLPASVFVALSPAFLVFLGLLSLSTAAGVSAGVFSPQGAPSAPVHMAQLVLAYGAGTALASLYYQLVSGWFAAMAMSGPASEASTATRTLLSQLVAPGPQHSADLVGSVGVVGAAAMVNAAAVASAHAPQLHSITAVTAYPLLVIAFSLLASAVASMVVRREATERPLAALARGLVVCVVLSAGSLAGIAQWVFDRLWTGPLLASLAGLAGGVLVIVLGGSMGVGGAADKGAAGAAWSMGRGFERAAALLAVVLVSLLGGEQVVGIGSLDQAGPLGAAMAVMGFLTLAPFLLIASAFGALSSAGPNATRDVQQRRMEGATAAYATAAAVLAGAVGVQAYSSTASRYLTAAPMNGERLGAGAAPAMVGLLLVMVVVGHVLSTLGRAVGVARRGKDGEPEALSSTAEMTSYAHGAVRLGLTSSLWVMGWSAVGWLITAGVAWRAQRGMYESTLIWLMLVVAGGGAMSAAFGAPAMEPAASGKTAVDGGADSANNLGHGAAIVNDSLGIPFGYVAGPALHAFARLLPAVVAALAPLVH